MNSTARTPLRDAAVALSLANLLCLPIWMQTLYLLSESNEYFMADGARPAWPHLWAIGIALGLAAAFFFGSKLRDRQARWRSAWDGLFWLAFSLALLFATLQVPGVSEGTHADSALALGVLLPLFVLVVRVARLIGWNRLAYACLLALAPFAGVTLVQAAGGVARSVFGSSPRPPRALGGAVAPRRLAVVVLDEFDETTAFWRRPASLALPELDRLRQVSWVGENTFPMSNRTMSSIPAIVSGRPVREARALGRSHLGVNVGSVWMSWQSLPSLFATADHEGFRPAIVGWYHPYCRIFGDHAYYCREYSLYPDPAPSEYPALFLNTTINTLPGIRLLQLDNPLVNSDHLQRDQHIRRYEAIHAEALAVLRERREVALLYVHYPIPHDPYIYDRRQRAFSYRSEYLDNLALADRAVGELAAAAEEAGVALLVTSDHSDRFRQRRRTRAGQPHPTERVPLILRIPGADEARRYTEVVRHTVVFELAMAYLRGQIRGPADVDAVAARHRDEIPRLP